MFRFIYQKYRWLSEIVPLFINAFKKGKELKLKKSSENKIKKNDILLFSTMKNEGHRLEFFLDYYRKLGINHFFIVDNGSTDNTTELLSNQQDVTHFYTEGSYKDSNFGMHWLNWLLFKYGRGHWCFTCDPDEFFVYPYMEIRDLRDLTEYLSSIREDSMFTLMVDMYGESAVEDAEYKPGTNPLSVCPYFDGTGYSKRYYHKYRNLFVQGGVRRRVFSKNEPGSAPALNKVPLIKWRWNYFYVESMHMALPRRLNNTCYLTKTSGALLHFKFISQLNDKVQEELVKKQHFNNSAEYKQYDKIIKSKQYLYDEKVSTKFTNWRDLAERGLINAGEW